MKSRTSPKRARRPSRRPRASVVLDATKSMGFEIPAMLPEWRSAADDVLSAIAAGHVRTGAAPLYSTGVVIDIPYGQIACHVYSSVNEAASSFPDDDLDHEPGCLCKHQHIMLVSLARIAEKQNFGDAAFERLLDDNMELLIDYMDDRS
jgi:hypothetical protein